MNITEKYSLFLSPRANNAGDPGKLLNDNFKALDIALWDLRTNFKDTSLSIEELPTGSFLFDDVSEEIYLKVKSGLRLLGSNSASGTGGGTGSLPTAEQLLDILYGRITSDQLITDLAEPIAQLPYNLIAVEQAKAAAVQAALDAQQAKADTISAMNDIQGFKNDAYDYLTNTTTQAQIASGFANTASTKASEAEASAGAAGYSAEASEISRLASESARDSSIDIQSAVIEDRNTTLSYKTAAEEAASAAHDYSIQAQISTVDASGYANSSLTSSESALAYSNQSGEYAQVASESSESAITAAGNAEAFSLQVANASGSIISAITATGLNAESASGFASQAHEYAVEASSSATQAQESAQLVASFLGATEVSGSIGLEARARADADSALAESISQVSTTVGEHTATLEVHQQSLDGISGEYTVKIDTDGNVAGFGLINSMASGSEFAVLADRFKVVAPGSTPEDGIQIFTVNGITGEIGINARVIFGSADDGTGGISHGGVLGKTDVKYLDTKITEDAELFSFTDNVTGSRGTGPTGSNNIYTRQYQKGKFGNCISIDNNFNEQIVYSGLEKTLYDGINWENFSVLMWLKTENMSFSGLQMIFGTWPNQFFALDEQLRLVYSWTDSVQKSAISTQLDPINSGWNLVGLSVSKELNKIVFFVNETSQVVNNISINYTETPTSFTLGRAFESDSTYYPTHLLYDNMVIYKNSIINPDNVTGIFYANKAFYDYNEIQVVPVPETISMEIVYDYIEDDYTLDGYFTPLN